MTVSFNSSYDTIELCSDAMLSSIPGSRFRRKGFRECGLTGGNPVIAEAFAENPSVGRAKNASRAPNFAAVLHIVTVLY